jgi:hypothetical protein
MHGLDGFHILSLSTSHDRVPYPVPSQGLSSHSFHTLAKFFYSSFRLSPFTCKYLQPIPSHSHSYAPDVRTILVFHVSPYLIPLPHSNNCTTPSLIFCRVTSHIYRKIVLSTLPSSAYSLLSSARFHCHSPKPFAHTLNKLFVLPLETLSLNLAQAHLTLVLDASSAPPPLQSCHTCSRTFPRTPTSLSPKFPHP